MNQITPDSWIERRGPEFGITTDDAGICPNCGEHIDDRCECTEEEREEAS